MAKGALYCNRCGTQNSGVARFCANGGNPFSADLQQAVPPPPVTPQISPQPQAPVWQSAPVSYAAAVPAVRYGGFWMRFVAAIIYLILVEFVVFPVAAVFGAMIGLAGGGEGMAPRAGPLV